MKVAIMQPYIFPYIGYFQLINAVDIFVLYDDVDFIKQGWINRNKILLNKKAHTFTIPCKNVSSFSKINNIEHNLSEKTKSKLLKTISQSYTKAPFFNAVMPLVESVLISKYHSISDLCIISIRKVLEYLEISTELKISSIDFADTINLDRTDRLIEITKRLNGTHYINPMGGKDLYSKDDFHNKGIKLSFIRIKAEKYEQFGNDFVPNLSIIDVLMFNNKEKVKSLLNEYILS